MRRLPLKRVGGLLIVIAFAAGAVGAFGYWSGSGSGTATTVIVDAQSLTFEPGSPTTQLYPGSDAGVAIVVSNPNAFSVHIGSMVLDTNVTEPFVADASHSGCDVSVLSFIPQDNGGAGWQVPPRAGSTDGTLAVEMPGAMKMSSEAASACQGATFAVHLEARP